MARQATSKSGLAVSLIRSCLIVLWATILAVPQLQAQQLDALLEETDRDTAWVNSLYKESLANYRSIGSLSHDSLIMISEQLKLTSNQLNYDRGLYRAIYIKSLAYRGDHEDSVTYYLRKGLAAIPDPNSSLAASANLVLANQYRFLGQFESAFVYAENSLKLAIEHDETQIIASSYETLGRVYTRSGELAKALYHHRQAVIHFEDLGDKDATVATLERIGVVYDYLKDYEKAYEVIKQSIVLRKDLSLESGRPYEMSDRTQNNLGRLLIKRRQYGLAIDTLQGLIRKLDEQADVFIRFPRYNLGNAYLSIGQLDSALFYLKLAADQAEGLDDNFVISLAYNDLGLVYQQQGREDLALRSFKRAYEAAQNRNAYTAELINASYALYEAYQRRGDMARALTYHKAWSEAKDSLLNAEKATQMALQEADYRFEKERNELEANQERERLALQSELRRREIIQWATAVIGLISLIFMAYVMNVLQKKKKANRLIQQQNEQITQTSNELKKLSEFKEGLTHMVAHDMKNSLNSIISVSSEVETLDSQRLKLVRQAGDNVLNLVTTMLDVQRFEETQVELSRERTYAHNLLKNAHKRIVVLAQGKSIKFHFEAVEDIPLDVDNDLIVRVLMNLLTNAIKFSPNGANIWLRSKVVYEDGPFMKFSVSDEGEGIPEDQLPFIFDKFRQVEARGTGSASSSGLGLTFCKLAVEAHEGHIWAESGLGKGTNIHFTLPISEGIDISGTQTSEMIITDQKVTGLPEDQSVAMHELLVDLRNCKIYEIQKIKSLLAEFKEDELDPDWKEMVWNAALKGNKDQFDRLLQSLV